MILAVGFDSVATAQRAKRDVAKLRFRVYRTGSIVQIYYEGNNPAPVIELLETQYHDRIEYSVLRSNKYDK